MWRITVYNVILTKVQNVVFTVGGMSIIIGMKNAYKGKWVGGWSIKLLFVCRIYSG